VSGFGTESRLVGDGEIRLATVSRWKTVSTRTVELRGAALSRRAEFSS
jgi:hypothetical protein